MVISEPPHRKEQSNRRRTVPRRLVKSTSDFQFRTSILELEIKLLSLEVQRSEFERLTKVNKGILFGRDFGDISSSDSDEEIELDTFVTNSLPDRDVDKINNKFEVKDFNVAVMNPGGLNSKRESIINAVHKCDIRALIVSETHMVGKEVPVLDRTMEAFFLNRSREQNKGGVCIFLEKTLAETAVVVGKSDSDHEWLAVKINYFHPPVVLVGVYGCQTSKNTVGALKEKWSVLWDFVGKYTDNNTVIVGGDLNSAIGRKAGMTNNCPSTNSNGKFLLRGVRDNNLRILNSLYKGDQRTHKDRSSDSFRCLDYILSNNVKACTRVFVDNKLEITPYRVMSVSTDKPHGVRKYTDHVTVLCTFDLKKKDSVKVGPAKPIIVRNEEGEEKFRQMTEAVADLAVEKLNSGEDILKVLKLVMRKVSEAERLAYTRIIVTSVKRKMWSDNEAFMKLTRDLEKEAERVMNCKTNDKIFKARGQKILKERHEEVSAMYNDKGEVVEDKEAINHVLTVYNTKLLSREPHPVDFEEIHRMKKEVVDTLDKTKIEEYNTLTPRDYTRAIQRIMNKGKNMFKTFLSLHAKLQAVFFFIFKRIYEEEVTPECFIETFLIALHKKNDKKDPGNYRFLHMRMDLSRVYELLVYLKLENHFDQHTAESQMGGRKDGDTVEHLAMLTSILKAKEQEENAGVQFLMVDSVKCFDRSWLSDNHAILQMEGADRKALKTMYRLQKKNVINVAGSKEKFVIDDGVGQGSVGGARITTSAITECTERHLNKLDKGAALKHRNQIISQQGFVDDVILIAMLAVAARACALLYSDALSELAMSAHPVKSVQILAGKPEWVQSFKQEMEKEPCKLQGFEVKQAEAEKYLGMYFISATYKETIDYNLRKKHGVIQATASEIRNICEMPLIKRYGKTAAQKLLIQSQIVPQCLYGTQAYIMMEDEQYAALENSFKEAITTVMSVPKNTFYAALLKVNGLMYIEHFVDMVKLKMFNYKLNIKSSGRLVRVIREEIRTGRKGGLAEDLTNLSKKYNISDICSGLVAPEVIRTACRQASYRRQWREHLQVRHVPMMDTADKVRYTWHEMPNNIARGLLLKELGLLITKDSQPHKFLERNMRSPKDRECLFYPLCHERDTYRHLLSGECPYYSTRLKVTDDPVMDEGIFIDKMSKERARLFMQPLVTFGGSDLSHQDDVLDDPAIQYNNMRADFTISDVVTKYEKVDNKWKVFPPSRYNGKDVMRLDNMCTKVINGNPESVRATSRDSSHSYANVPTLAHTAESSRCKVTATSSLLIGLTGSKKQSQSQRQMTNMTKLTDLQASLLGALSVIGSKLRNTKSYSYLKMIREVKVNGEKKVVELEGDITIETHSNETTIYVGPESYSTTNIQVRSKVGSGSDEEEFRENIITKSFLAKANGNRVQTTTISIIRKKMKEGNKAENMAGTKRTLLENQDAGNLIMSSKAAKEPKISDDSEDSSPARGSGPRRLTKYRSDLPIKMGNKVEGLSDISEAEDFPTEPAKIKPEDLDPISSDTEAEPEKDKTSSDTEYPGSAPTSETDIVLRLPSSELAEFRSEVEGYEEGEVREEEENTEDKQKTPGRVEIA